MLTQPIITHLLAAAAEPAPVSFQSRAVEVLIWIVAAVAGVVIAFVGYKFGKWVGTSSASKLIAAKEQELFTAQKGFKNLYETEMNQLKAENESLRQQVSTLNDRVEEYRKKAAGLGGLFGSGGKKADAMYALLLENEALEEALYSQNEKLRQERTDSLKEQMRATGYRRVLMSQLLNDDRIKSYVAEIMNDDRRLPPGPASAGNRAALPHDTVDAHHEDAPR